MKRVLSLTIVTLLAGILARAEFLRVDLAILEWTE